MTEPIISYFSTCTEHFLLSKALVVDLLIYFYNFKSFHPIIQPARLEGKRSCSHLRTYLFTMPPIRCRRPAFRRLALSAALLGPKLSLGPESASAVPPNNNFFLEFMQTCINTFWSQAPVASAEARNATNRLYKSWNPNLFHSNLHMKYCYFCQQREDYFEVAGSLGNKRILFAAEFLKNYIFNL